LMFFRTLEDLRTSKRDEFYLLSMLFEGVQ